MSTSAAPCDGYDWRDGTPRECALRLGHKGSCSGDPCEHPVYMDGRCYDCGAPHPADCDCGMRPPVDPASLPVDRSRDA